MYLHIGNNILINKNEIIGIFDIESLKNNKKNLLDYNKMINDNEIIDISDGKQKTYILLKQKHKILIYISNISSLTIEKRIKEDSIE